MKDFGFEKLNVYSKSMEFTEKIFDVFEKLPFNTLFIRLNRLQND